MKSYGVEVPEIAINAGLSAMVGNFTALDVECAIRRTKTCPDQAVPNRIADKLLQRERRAGRIAFANGKWSKTP